MSRDDRGYRGVTESKGVQGVTGDTRVDGDTAGDIR